jgi:hypothetical protein
MNISCLGDCTVLPSAGMVCFTSVCAWASAALQSNAALISIL